MKNTKWEIFNYVSLTLCLIGQVFVGKWYLIAQSAYLVANMIAVIRDFKIKMPPSNCIRDCIFLFITIVLIISRVLTLF